MTDIIKAVCPEHQIELVPKQTKRFGVRHECPVRGCSVAWWGRQSATPADARTRKARHDFSEAYLRLQNDEADQVLAWFAENDIEGPGFMTAEEAGLAIGFITRLWLDAEAIALRELIATSVTQLSKAGQAAFVRLVASQVPGVNLRECSDVVVLTRVRNLVSSLLSNEREEAGRRQQQQGRARRPSQKRTLPPVEPTKTKRKLDL